MEHHVEGKSRNSWIDCGFGGSRCPQLLGSVGPGTRYGIYEGIRETYDGLLSMATDMMVWSITEDGMTERMSVTTDDAWSVPGAAQQPPPDKLHPNPMSDDMEAYGLQDQDWRPKMYEDVRKLEGE